MGELHTFPKPNRKRATLARHSLAADAATRAHIEEAAQHAIDTAERLIAILDGLDANPDDEDSGEAEPSLGALEGRDSQVVWLRGTDRDLEIDHTPEMDS